MNKITLVTLLFSAVLLSGCDDKQEKLISTRSLKMQPSFIKVLHFVRLAQAKQKIAMLFMKFRV